jgi:hypothetical protein
LEKLYISITSRRLDMRSSFQKRGLVVILLLILALVGGCTSLGSNSKTDPNTKYYQGYKGIDMEFTKSMPPDRMYFYGTSEDNTFDVNVEVKNQGSSWSRGGIFVSGYDPNMIQIYGINPARGGGQSCRLDVGNIGLGAFGGTLRCADYYLGVSGIGGDDNTINYMDVGIKSIWEKLGLESILGKSGNIYVRNNNGEWGVSYSNSNIDLEYAGHGRLMLAVFSGINFARTFGQEYLLQGNTYEYPGGELAYLNFDGQILNWPQGLDQTYQTFMITNCYMYTTYAAPVVCIDPAPFSENAKVCTPKTYTGTSGQGAPVAVTSIEQENTARQAIFTINIKNVGGGQVYDPGRLEKCSPYSPARVTQEDLNVVYVGDIRVSGDLQRLECTPNDFVRLDPTTGTGVITCSYEIPYTGLKSAYQAPLVVELWYGYSKTMEKRVLIKRAI